MQLSISPLPNTLADIVSETQDSGKITQSDRYGLLALLLQNSLSEEEAVAINRLLYAVRRGWLKVDS